MGNLRIPSMRISSEHVAGVLKFLDQRAEAKAAPVAPTPPLRFPHDFPGARPTLQRDLKLLGDHGSDADVIIELDALYEESAAVMVASAEGMDAAEQRPEDIVDLTVRASQEEITALLDAVEAIPAGAITVLPKGMNIEFQPVDEGAVAQESRDKAVQGECSTIPSCPEGGRENEGDQLASEPAMKPVAPPQVHRAAEVAPERVAPAPVPTVRHSQPAKRGGKTAAQERLHSAAPITTKAPTPTPAFISRPDPMTVRRERLTKAIGWLKREHRILVSVVDRDAALRTYSVSGKRYTMLADHVIDYAVSLGMAIDG